MNSEDQDHGDTQVPLWPEQSTAFVVIHGSGPHRPFEALDSFARGFWKWRTVKHGMDMKWSHELRRRNGWTESYLSMVPVPDGKPALDFYEYYWDCCMVRDVTLGEVADWLDEVSAGAHTFYRIVMPQRGGYMLLLRCLRVLAPCKFLIGSLRGWNSRLLDNSIGDVVIYTTSDVRSQNYEIRQEILSKAVEELSILLNSGYGQVVVVGHSLGSIIAYDAFNRIALDVKTGRLDPTLALKLTGLVTLGSPLDKTAFFYDNRAFTQQEKARREQGRRPAGKQNVPEPFPQEQIVSHLHSFRRIPLSVDPGEEIDIEDPIGGNLDNAAWLNFYHRKDLYSDCLRAYRSVDNIECKEHVWWLRFWEAHNVYWDWDDMYESIAGQFFK